MNGIPLVSVVGLLLALGVVPLLAFYKHGDKAGAIDQRRHLVLTWGGCLALLALVLGWERRPLASIGIVWGNYQAWAWGAALGLSMLSITAASVHFSLRAGKSPMAEGSAAGLKRLTSTPLWFRYAAVLTAGITEEIVFRGYPIARLHEMTGNMWLAAALPLAVFVLAHLSAWSADHLVGVLIAGSLLTGFYLWQQDLVACMIAHAIIDLPVVFLPWLMRHSKLVKQ